MVTGKLLVPCASKETFPLSALAVACLGWPHNKLLLRARPLTLACQEENLSFTQWGNFSKKRRWLTGGVAYRQCGCTSEREGSLVEKDEGGKPKPLQKRGPHLEWDKGKKKTWIGAG